MPMRDYYTVDRSPQEIRDLWEWARNECHGQVPHKNLYAFGVLVALEYLMGEDTVPPQIYKGRFDLETVLRQSNPPEDIGNAGNALLNKPLHNDLDSFRPGNPKYV